MNYQILVKGECSVSPQKITQVAKTHLAERKAKPGIFEVETISQNEIKKINNKYRQIDAPTDVLSFPAAEFPLPTGRQAAREKLYGTILLCCDIIRLNADKAGKTFEKEFNFILKHGLDHLLGIHHK